MATLHADPVGNPDMKSARFRSLHVSRDCVLSHLIEEVKHVNSRVDSEVNSEAGSLMLKHCELDVNRLQL